VSSSARVHSRVSLVQDTSAAAASASRRRDTPPSGLEPALGIVIGISPCAGITTLVVVLLAWTFGLNQVASQIGAHAMTPFLESDAAVITEWGGGADSSPRHADRMSNRCTTFGERNIKLSFQTF
jgi:hypothetical protein